MEDRITDPTAAMASHRSLSAWIERDETLLISALLSGDQGLRGLFISRDTSRGRLPPPVFDFSAGVGRKVSRNPRFAGRRPGILWRGHPP